MACETSSTSYSHTEHFVILERFDDYIDNLLITGNKLDHSKKEKLEALVKTEIWEQVRLSSYWRHNILNGGLSGPFTEYFATFELSWQTDFWGAPVQEIERNYLGNHAIPKAYQATVAKTRELIAARVSHLQNSGQEEIRIASLACGTMYDVLETAFTISEGLEFHGYDLDRKALDLAQQKANSQGYAEQLTAHVEDIVTSQLPENQYDIVICNGFSFYIDDQTLLSLIENVNNALTENGIFIMSLIQPPSEWKMSQEEKKADTDIQQILQAVPMNWNAHLRTIEAVSRLFKQAGFFCPVAVPESHGIHPCLLSNTMEK